MRPAKASGPRAGHREAARTANLLGAAALAIAGAIEDSMGRSGMRSQAANTALVILLQWPPRSIGGLSQVLRRSHSATVRLVEELEGDGLVTKQPGVDRRSVVVALTAKGRRESAAILSLRAQALDGVVADLALADRLDLTRIVEKILAALTPDRETSDHICRLCQLAACPQDRCPVELAALGATR
jgi:MarR family transcriptional regulator, negative regulator of the multidrug operon emrRAB